MCVLGDCREVTLGDSPTMTCGILTPLQACENGRGAILLSVARGKVSEGIDFGELQASPCPLP